MLNSLPMYLHYTKCMLEKQRWPMCSWKEHSVVTYDLQIITRHNTWRLQWWQNLKFCWTKTLIHYAPTISHLPNKDLTNLISKQCIDLNKMHMPNARSRGTWRRTCFSTKLKSITKTTLTWSYPPKPLRSSNYKHNRRQPNSNLFWCTNLTCLRRKLHALAKSAHTHTQLKNMYSHYVSLSLSFTYKECMTVAHHPCALTKSVCSPITHILAKGIWVRST